MCQPPLSEGEQAILRRLERGPLDLYWGRNGWVPERLPRASKRADFDRLCKHCPALVKIELGRLVAAESETE